jgi:hypothetical protein
MNIKGSIALPILSVGETPGIDASVSDLEGGYDCLMTVLGPPKTS